MRHFNRFRAARDVVSLLAALACLALAPGAVRAADFNVAWIGGPTGNWNTASNWSGGAVPNNTQAASYLATVANSATQYTQVTMNLPSVELKQLTIRRVSSVVVPTGSVLRLRDTGAGTSLVRSFGGVVGPESGGVLRLSGGRLDVAINGGVISGNAAIRLADGRVGGFGRIENTRFDMGGYGTIGNAAGQSDSGLSIHNIGQAGIGSPNFTRIMADSPGRVLTLGPGSGAGTTGITNNLGTLGAEFGGTLVLRGNGTSINNDQGRILADTGSEVHLAANAIVNSLTGKIEGPGTVRVPAGEVAFIDAAPGNISVEKLAVDGTLELNRAHTNLKQVEVSGRLIGTAQFANFANATTGTLRLQPAATGTPVADFTGRVVSNGGQISGGGQIITSRIDNSGTITATSTAKPLHLDGSLILNAGSTLRSAAGTMIVGKTSGIGSASWGSATVTVDDGAAMDFNVPLTSTSGAITNNGTLTLRGPTASTLSTITGMGSTFVRGPLTIGTFRTGSVQVESPVTLKAAVGTSRSNSLTFVGSGALNLAVNPYVVDYASGAASPLAALRSAVVAGKIYGVTDPNYVVGYGEATAIGSPTTWRGETIDTSVVLLLPTRRGDANLDGAVGFADLVKLAQNYNRTSGVVWTDGDSNYDGRVDFADLVLLAQNYSGAAAIVNNATADFAADWAMAQSLVPEPSAVVLLAAVSLIVRRRRCVVGVAL